MFGEQYRRDNEKLHAKETLLMEIKKERAAQQRHTAGRAKFARYGALAAAAVLVLAGALGVAFSRPAKVADLSAKQAAAAAETFDSAEPAQASTDAAVLESIAETVVDEAATTTSAPAAGAASAESGARAAHTVNSYDELFSIMESMGVSMGSTRRYGAPEPAAESAVEEAAPAADMATTSGTAKSATMDMGEAGGDYSTTNVQVAGVDEADIVKCDGKYIYYVANNQLNIISADGKDAKVLSSTMLESGDAWWGYASEMFLQGDRLMLITQGSSVVWVADGGYNDNRDMTQIRLFDVSDPTKPACIATLGQSGSYVSSRMTADGTVYLVTTHYVYQPVRTLPNTFVPELTVNGTAKTVAATDIYAFDNTKSLAYTVISSVSIASGRDFSSVKALFGATGDVYCSGAHLLLANYDTEQNVTPIAPDTNGKNVQTTTSRAYTQLTLFTLDGENIRLAANGRLPGSLVNQFAMDEYKDVFRIVTTDYRWTERVYTDGVDAYEYENTTSNGLYILDASLNVLGSVEDLAKDEQVHSVRFDGDIAYFVTFRQVDPLFAVDVSNPRAPRVLSALKIPGFSEYLHVFGDGLLLGLGYQADEKTGVMQGVKLSMFDTSDKKNVRELVTEPIDADWSIAGSNHKAILVDVEKGLFAFPADSAYYIYRYTKADGFTQLAKIVMTDDLYSWNLRGVFSGDCFYVLSNSAVTVVSMQDWSTLARLTIAYG